MGGGIWEISVPSPQFCYETKTALKELSVNLKRKTKFMLSHFQSLIRRERRPERGEKNYWRNVPAP